MQSSVISVVTPIFFIRLPFFHSCEEERLGQQNVAVDCWHSIDSTSRFIQTVRRSINPQIHSFIRIQTKPTKELIIMTVKICSHHRGAPGRVKALPLTTNTTINIGSNSFSCERYGEQKIATAATEIEIMRLREEDSATTKTSSTTASRHQRFPPVCLYLLRSLPGNNKCMDCGQSNPEWASISYGALLCLSCAGKHRGLGVKTSKVRSVSMDSWTHTEVLSMLEGGNGQLSAFYARHFLCEDSYRGHNKDAVNLMRYKTKAALFYRKNLDLHVDKVCAMGVYKGREASRKLIVSKINIGSTKV